MMVIFQPFRDDTILIRYQCTVYKVRILYDTETVSQDVIDTFNNENCSNEIEDAFRALLFMEQENEKFRMVRTDHFLITTERKKWKAANKLQFNCQSTVLMNHPFFLILNIKIRSDIPVITDPSKVCMEKVSCPTAGNSYSKKLIVHQKSAEKEGPARGQTEKYSFRSKTISNSTKKDHVDLNLRDSDSSSVEPKNQREKSTSHCQQDDVSSELQNSRHIRRNTRQTCKTLEKSVHNTTEVNYHSQENASADSWKIKHARSGTGQGHNTADQCDDDDERTLSNKGIDVESSENRRQKEQTRSCQSKKLVNSESQQTSPKLVVKKPSSNSKHPTVHVKRNVEENTDNRESSQRITRQFIKQLKDDESTRLQILQFRKTPERRHRTRAKIDRHLIEEEELDEELKLQQISGPSDLRRSPRRHTSSLELKNSRKRRSSGLWDFAEFLFVPFKKLWKNE